MMRRYWKVLLAALAMMLCLFALAGCGLLGGMDKGIAEESPEGMAYFLATGGSFSDLAEHTYQETMKGEKLTEPEAPTWFDHVFVGWAKDEGGTEMWDFDRDTVEESDLYLYAVWKDQPVELLGIEGATLRTDGSYFLIAPPASETYALADKVNCAEGCDWEVYMRNTDGKEFFEDKAVRLPNQLGENEYTIHVTSDNSSRDATYFLIVHVSHEVSVNYYSGDGLLRSDKVYTGEVYEATFTPELEGYEFLGWKRGNGEEFTSGVVMDKLNLYAIKNSLTYTITFDVNGGDPIETTELTVEYKGANVKFPVPTRTGYTFDGWYNGDTYITNAKYSLQWEKACDMDLTAHWSANRYNLVLEVGLKGAGTVSGNGYYLYDESVTVTAKTNRGYNFIGWYSSDDRLLSLREEYTFSMGLAAVIVAKWDFYTVTTQNNIAEAGKTNYMDSGKVSIGDTAELSVTETSLGYEWVGWFRGEECLSEETSCAFPMEKKENVVIEARWKVAPEMENYEFTSTAKTCTIFRIKDTSLEEVVIPAYVTRVEEGALSGCGNLVKLTTPNFGGYFGIFFGKDEFEGCEAVADAYYAPASLRTIVVTNGKDFDNAFNDFAMLTSVTLPSPMGQYSDTTFLGCVDLERVVFNACGSAKSIDRVGTHYSPLRDCKRLREVIFTESVGYISDYFLAGCHTLSKVTFEGETLTGIGQSAFYGCVSLTQIEIPKSVESIETNAFEACHSLVEIWNHSDLEIVAGDHSMINGAIGSYAKIVHKGNEKGNVTTDKDGFVFYEDKTESLLVSYHNFETEIVLPSRSPSGRKYQVHDYAFDNNETVTAIDFTGGFTGIGQMAFSNKSLKRFGPTEGVIEIPAEVTFIGENAFNACQSIDRIIWNAIDCTVSSGTQTFPYTVTCVVIGENVEKLFGQAFYGYNREYEHLTRVEFNARNCTRLEAFSDKYITEVVIGDKVESIPSNAFAYLRGLKSISIPENVTSIGSSAFEYCEALADIELPNTICSIGVDAFKYTAYAQDPSHRDASNVLYIGNYLIEGSNLTGAYTIPADTITIANGAFYEKKDVQIDLSAATQLIGIGDGAFRGCDVGTSLTFGLGSPLRYLGGSAFLGCVKLQAVDFGNCTLLPAVGERAFRGCTSLASANFGGCSCLKAVGASAFEGCTALLSVTLPDSVASIGSDAFKDTPYSAQEHWEEDGWYIGSILYAAQDSGSGIFHIKSGTTGVTQTAFSSCTSLKELHIPESLTDLDALSWPRSLERIVVAEGNPRYASQDGILYNADKTILLYAPSRVKGKITIPASVTEIKSYVMMSRTDITEIVFEKGSAMERITQTAFSGLTSLESIVLPDGLKEIERGAFSGCSRLSSIEFPSTLKVICENAFANCSKLSAVILPDGVEEVKSGAFGRCNSLEMVYLPDSLLSISNSAFASDGNFIAVKEGTASIRVFSMLLAETKDEDYNYRLACYSAWEKINLMGEGDIPDGLFYLCDLREVVIPEGVTSIGIGAFSGCDRLRIVEIPSSVKRIGAKAFTRTLTELTIPDLAAWCDIEFDDESANPMQYATAIRVGGEIMTTFTLPAPLTEIKPYTFYHASSILEIVLHGELRVIGKGAFAGCTGVTALTLPEGVTVIGEDAFSGCSALASISMPSTLISSGNNAFLGCDSLTRVDIPDLEAWCKVDFPVASANPLSRSKALYQDGELMTRLVLPSSVTELKRNTFCYLTALKEIVLHENVTAFSSYTFQGCTGVMFYLYGTPSHWESLGFYDGGDCAFYSEQKPTSLQWTQAEKWWYLEGDEIRLWSKH